MKVCGERYNQKSGKNNGTKSKGQEENTCDTGGDRMPQAGCLKSSPHVPNVTVVLAQHCRPVALTCQAKGNLLCVRLSSCSKPGFILHGSDSPGAVLMHPGLVFLAASSSSPGAGVQGMPVVLLLSVAIPEPIPSPNLGCEAAVGTRLSLLLLIILSRPPGEQTHFPKGISHRC